MTRSALITLVIPLKDSLTVTEQIEIQAPPIQVWEVLSDLAAHNHWNPNFRVEEAPAYLEVGAQAQLCAAPGTSQERVFTVEILQVTAPTVLVWQGGEPGVLQGIHRFELEELGPCQTRLVNCESFSGAMVVTVLQTSRASLEQEFAAFNEALKQRVEAGED